MVPNLLNLLLKTVSFGLYVISFLGSITIYFPNALIYSRTHSATLWTITPEWLTGSVNLAKINKKTKPLGMAVKGCSDDIN